MILQISKMTKEQIIELTKYGWYISFETTPRFLPELDLLLKNDNYKEVNKRLISEYKDTYERRLNALKTQFPCKENILDEVNFCYKNEKYFAAVSLVLTQVDSICYDKTNYKFLLITALIYLSFKTF